MRVISIKLNNQPTMQVLAATKSKMGNKPESADARKAVYASDLKIHEQVKAADEKHAQAMDKLESGLQTKYSMKELYARISGKPVSKMQNKKLGMTKAEPTPSKPSKKAMMMKKKKASMGY